MQQKNALKMLKKTKKSFESIYVIYKLQEKMDFRHYLTPFVGKNITNI